MAERESNKGTVQSVSRAVAVLRCFYEREELGLSEISRMIGLHKSTTAGLVNTLKAERLLEQNEATGRFRLGLELFRLSVHLKFDLKEICEPYLDELARLTGETVNLVVRDGDSAVYAGKRESPYSMRICTSLGQRIPLYCSAAGKAILAFLSEEEVDGFLDRIELEQHTSNTMTDPVILKARLRRVRALGYACDAEEMEYGLVCVAVPILDRRGRPAGSISVSGPSVRMNEQTREEIAAKLLEAAVPIRKEFAARSR